MRSISEQIGLTKYELLGLFNHYLKNDKVLINPIDGVCANKSLIRTRFDFSYQIPDYEIMIAELADWMKIHRCMYPHYNL